MSLARIEATLNILDKQLDVYLNQYPNVKQNKISNPRTLKLIKDVYQKTSLLLPPGKVCDVFGGSGVKPGT